MKRSPLNPVVGFCLVSVFSVLSLDTASAGMKLSPRSEPSSKVSEEPGSASGEDELNSNQSLDQVITGPKDLLAERFIDIITKPSAPNTETSKTQASLEAIKLKLNNSGLEEREKTALQNSLTNAQLSRGLLDATPLRLPREEMLSFAVLNISARQLLGNSAANWSLALKDQFATIYTAQIIASLASLENEALKSGTPVNLETKSRAFEDLISSVQILRRRVLICAHCSALVSASYNQLAQFAKENQLDSLGTIIENELKYIDRLNVLRESTLKSKAEPPAKPQGTPDRWNPMQPQKPLPIRGNNLADFVEREQDLHTKI